MDYDDYYDYQVTPSLNNMEFKMYGWTKNSRKGCLKHLIFSSFYLIKSAELELTLGVEESSLLDSGKSLSSLRHRKY